MEVTSTPNPEDEKRVIEATRLYNSGFNKKDVLPLCVFDRNENGTVIGGLTGKTYWNYLDVGYLWVDENYRNQGRAKAILEAAEEEAFLRGCRHVLLDTYSFQALGFYLKQGYEEFGSISGFSGRHSKHYLHKFLVDTHIDE